MNITDNKVRVARFTIKEIQTIKCWYTKQGKKLKKGEPGRRTCKRFDIKYSYLQGILNGRIKGRKG